MLRAHTEWSKAKRTYYGRMRISSGLLYHEKYNSLSFPLYSKTFLMYKTFERSPLPSPPPLLFACYTWIGNTHHTFVVTRIVVGFVDWYGFTTLLILHAWWAYSITAHYQNTNTTSSSSSSLSLKIINMELEKTQNTTTSHILENIHAINSWWLLLKICFIKAMCDSNVLHLCVADILFSSRQVGLFRTK